jgi:hypothetical protein
MLEVAVSSSSAETWTVGSAARVEVVVRVAMKVWVGVAVGDGRNP